jgi:hypothetical protein
MHLTLNMLCFLFFIFKLTGYDLIFKDIFLKYK